MQHHICDDTMVIECNLAIIKEPIGKIRELHAGFRMLSESFAVSLKEFQQIFSMSEAVFSVWDTDSNGLIDLIEFFTGMIIFANARVEDKLRFLIDLFDFNQNGFLQDMELQFMVFNVLTATAKTFGVESEGPSF
jgi:Ca2+-binding EF-hand superfamily protein